MAIYNNIIQLACVYNIDDIFHTGVMGYMASPIFCTPAQNILECLAPPIQNILRIFGTPSGKNVPLIELRLALIMAHFFFIVATKKKMACAVQLLDTLNQNLLYIKSLLSHTSYIISISISWTTNVQKSKMLQTISGTAGADPGGVLWVLKHPPSGLRYNIIDTASQLLTVVEYTVLM